LFQLTVFFLQLPEPTKFSDPEAANFFLLVEKGRFTNIIFRRISLMVTPVYDRLMANTIYASVNFDFS
jgi:hypothetical protein